MKKTTLLSRFLALLVIIIIFASCGKEKNVVTDYEPMTDALRKGFPLDSFKRSDSATKQAIIDYYRPMLVQNVRDHLGDCITPDSIEFVFGSGHAKKVQNATGKPVNGKFENELIIIVKNKCHPGAWFLACGNGMLGDFNFTSSHSYGDGCQIIIKPGESLATYWEQLKQWSKVAKQLRVPIRNAKGDVVSANVYETTLGSYESVLFPYDRLNVCTGEVTDKDGKHIDAAGFKKRVSASDNLRKAEEKKKQEAENKRKAELRKKQNKKTGAAKNTASGKKNTKQTGVQNKKAKAKK